jgi:hypothetical protein
MVGILNLDTVNRVILMVFLMVFEFSVTDPAENPGFETH